MKVHRWWNIRVKGSPIKFPLEMLKKGRDRNPVMNPRTDNLVTPNPSHERVPLIGELMQIAATKKVRVAQTQILKIGKDTAGQNIRRRG